MDDVVRSKVIDRLKAMTTIDENGCWLWSGTDRGHGYCQMKIDGRAYSVHRAAYEALVGPIPEGMQIDHLCRVRRCGNPAHLEAVTSQENIRRSRAATPPKTHCKNGHMFNEQNTRTSPRGHRECRACDREKHRTQYLTWETK